MRNGLPLLVTLATQFLVGCDPSPALPESNFVPMAFLNSIEVESVSLIEEKEGENKVLVRIPCSALVGIDLANAEYENSPGNLTVTLPEPTVNSPKVHSDGVEILDEKQEKWWWTSSSVNPELKEKAERKAQAEISNLAKSTEVVSRAKNEARRLIECFYRQTTPGRSVKIVWKNNQGGTRGEN